MRYNAVKPYCRQWRQAAWLKRANEGSNDKQNVKKGNTINSNKTQMAVNKITAKTQWKIKQCKIKYKMNK